MTRSRSRWLRRLRPHPERRAPSRRAHPPLGPWRDEPASAGESDGVHQDPAGLGGEAGPAAYRRRLRAEGVGPSRGRSASQARPLEEGGGWTERTFDRKERRELKEGTALFGVRREATAPRRFGGGREVVRTPRSGAPSQSTTSGRQGQSGVDASLCHRSPNNRSSRGRSRHRSSRAPLGRNGVDVLPRAPRPRRSEALRRRLADGCMGRRRRPGADRPRRIAPRNPVTVRIAVHRDRAPR